jgi:NAD(P)H dehydrogenase (quinone)
MTIALTGASGHLGRLALSHLLTLKDPSSLIGLVRDPASLADIGIAARHFDYKASDTLAPALAGVDTLVLISSSDFDDRVAQHANVIAAARDAGVGRIVYTSILKADRSPLLIAQDHRTTEALIADAGMAATILRNGWYTENWTATLGGAMAAGALIGSAGDARFTPATRADYATALAVVAASDDHVGQVLELAGDEGFTLADLAAEVSRQAGISLPYQDLPPVALQAILEQIGLPPAFAHLLVDVDQKAGAGWLADDSGTLARLIGRPTTRLTQAVAAALVTAN